MFVIPNGSDIRDQASLIDRERDGDTMTRRHKAKVGGVGKALKILEKKSKHRLEDVEEKENEEYDDYLDDQGNMLLEKDIRSEDDDDEEVFGLENDDEVWS